MLNTRLLEKNNFFRMEYDMQNAVFVITFSESEADMLMEQNDLKDILLKWIYFLQRYPTKYVVADHRKMLMTIAIETQEWIAQHIAPQLIDLGIKRYVQVLSMDFMSRMSGEQVIDEMLLANPKTLFDVQFAEDFQSAVNWLLIDKPPKLSAPIYMMNQIHRYAR